MKLRLLVLATASRCATERRGYPRGMSAITKRIEGSKVATAASHATDSAAARFAGSATAIAATAVRAFVAISRANAVRSTATESYTAPVRATATISASTKAGTTSVACVAAEAKAATSTTQSRSACRSERLPSLHRRCSAIVVRVWIRVAASTRGSWCGRHGTA